MQCMTYYRFYLINERNVSALPWEHFKVLANHMLHYLFNICYRLNGRTVCIAIVSKHYKRSSPKLFNLNHPLLLLIIWLEASTYRIYILTIRWRWLNSFLMIFVSISCFFCASSICVTRYKLCSLIDTLFKILFAAMAVNILSFVCIHPMH